MGADDLAFEQRPDAFNAVRVKAVVPHLFTGAVIDRVMIIVVRQADQRAVLVRHKRCARLHILSDNRLHRPCCKVRSHTGTEFTAAFQHTKDGNFTLAALFAASALRSMLVLLFPTHKRLFSFNLTVKGVVVRCRTARALRPDKSQYPFVFSPPMRRARAGAQWRPSRTGASPSAPFAPPREKPLS